jgi:hypothetical protein
MNELHFSITGEYVTNFVREKYKETNDISVAVDLLTKMLVGFPVDLATAVVLGNKKLVGTNEVEIEDDCTEVEPYGLIKPSKPEDVICGWISPEGNIYGHQSYNNQNDHHVLAIEICKRLDIDSFNEEWELEKLDYLKFQPDKVMAGDHAATMAQKKAVAEICKAHNCKMAIGWVNHNLYSGSQIEQMELIMFNKYLNR